MVIRKLKKRMIAQKRSMYGACMTTAFTLAGSPIWTKKIKIRNMPSSSLPEIR